MLKNWSLFRGLNAPPECKTVTHVGMDGGKLNITPKHIEAFNNVYCEAIRNNERQCLVEIRTRPEFRFYVDVDFLDDSEMSPEVFDFICNSCQSLLSPKDSIIACISEPKPKDGKVKTGIHIHWERIIHEDNLNGIITRLLSILRGKYPQYSWGDYIDTSVYRGGGLRMKWSHKFQNGKYFDPYIPALEISPHGIRDIPPGISSDILSRVTIRSDKFQPQQSTKQLLEGGFSKTDVQNQNDIPRGLEEFIQQNFEGQESSHLMCAYTNSQRALLKTNSKYCENLGRCHNSNHVYFYVNFRTNTIFQKCFCTCDTTKGRKSGECYQFKGKSHQVPLPLIIDLKPAPKIALTSMNMAIMNNFRKK